MLHVPGLIDDSFLSQYYRHSQQLRCSYFLEVKLKHSPLGNPFKTVGGLGEGGRKWSKSGENNCKFFLRILEYQLLPITVKWFYRNRSTIKLSGGDILHLHRLFCDVEEKKGE